MGSNSTLSIGLLYHNAPEMIDWLCKTFGFEKKLIVPGQGNQVAHAFLTYGQCGIMIASAEDYPNPTFCKSPNEI